MIKTTSRSYEYQTVPQDPLQVKMYTLANGLRLFMSVNPNEPRVFTNIAVRAGSKHDPPETTGLAHYMEHMLFKGTSRIGTLDWEKEKALLKRISDLYEEHRHTRDEDQRRAIYREIDRLSFEAAQLAAPSEYDKLVSAIGATSTNAYTWVEQTVYVNDIPGNELERWFRLESERFRMMALRLFHTELETVYEEFNISQDRDARKVTNALRAALFPGHPYGTQTTLGSAEHLRNPSQVNIQRFFQSWYRPNNMAIVLAGDFDPDQVTALAEQYFGHFEPAGLPPFHFEEQPPVLSPIRREVFGQEAPFVEIGWRLDGSHTNAPLLAYLVSQLLHNHQAGLLDLNLNQQQRVLESEAWTWTYEDFSVFGLYGKPRDGQSLEEVEALLLSELDRLRRGDFEDWLIEGVLRDIRLSEILAFEDNPHRVGALTNAFILGIPWEERIRQKEWIQQADRQSIIDFACRHLRDNNFAVVYKRQGADPRVVKVEKPPITPVQINRDAASAFAGEFLEKQSPALLPVFPDYEQLIHTRATACGLPIDYIHNPDNELFRLDLIFEMGKIHDRALPIALLYLPYLGTSRYSAARLQQEFFRLGLSIESHCNDERSYLSLSGLQESMPAGLSLMMHLLEDLRADEVAFRNVLSDLLVQRANAKRNRSVILKDALANYARYGSHSPHTFRLSESELAALRPEDLLSRLQGLTGMEHRIYYFGPAPVEQVVELLNRHYPAVGTGQRPLPAAEIFPQAPTLQNQVFFLDFPIVQADILLISRGTPYFSLGEHILREWYNQYFGLGLSSIVFQEIRESKALAYSTYAMYTSPRFRHQAHYLQAYVGTQPDKLPDAVPALLHILEEMPKIVPQMEFARQSILKRIESTRVSPRKAYWQYRSNADRGYTHELDRDIYQQLQQATPRELLGFQEQFVRNRHYHIAVLGSKDHVDRDYLSRFGPLQELSMEDVFGY